MYNGVKTRVSSGLYSSKLTVGDRLVEKLRLTPLVLFIIITPRSEIHKMCPFSYLKHDCSRRSKGLREGFTDRQSGLKMGCRPWLWVQRNEYIGWGEGVRVSESPDTVKIKNQEGRNHGKNRKEVDVWSRTLMSNGVPFVGRELGLKTTFFNTWNKVYILIYLRFIEFINGF